MFIVIARMPPKGRRRHRRKMVRPQHMMVMVSGRDRVMVMDRVVMVRSRRIELDVSCNFG